MQLTHSKNREFEKKKVLGVGLTIATEDQVLEYIITGLEKLGEKYYVVTPNPEILVISHKDQNYKKVLNGAKLALPDGVGVMIGGKILQKGLKHRVTGVDLVEKLCEGAAKKPITIGFLGAEPGVAEKAAECLQKRYSGLKVVLTESGNPNDETVNLIKEKIGDKKVIDLLFVAFGSPKQELWIAQNLDRLPVKVAIGVGGSFDFISGKVKRAPRWVRKIGFEWLYRLVRQPWRIKRQLSLIVFVFLVISELFSSKE